jgi:tetratricopeptide (TPR) repeat protein
MQNRDGGFILTAIWFILSVGINANADRRVSAACPLLLSTNRGKYLNPYWVMRWDSPAIRDQNLGRKIAVQLDPDYAPAWGNLALVAEKLGLDKESIQAHEKVIALGKGQGVNYFRLGVLYAKADQSDPAIAAFGKAIELEPEKYRAILREELKKVHSVLDSVRYKEAFMRLLNVPVR